MSASTAFVIGTWDTKGRELQFIVDCIRQAGVPVTSVDVSTRQGGPQDVAVSAAEVASFHPGGASAVMSQNDRGEAVTAMSVALERFVRSRSDIGGVIGAGGTGNTALLAPAFRSLPIATPKLIVSTVASGDVSAYVGPSDLAMMPSVADVQGINSISRPILANAAHALAGMLKWHPPAPAEGDKPSLGLTMFGVTTPCVRQVVERLSENYDCIVFHATGIGGQCMEKLAESGLLTGVLDLTTTEVVDLLVGGVFRATDDRFGAIARTKLPYVGSCGALDMVNFRAADTVPAKFQHRLLHVHNPQITLMRTSREENDAAGRWIADRLNRCDGPVRFLIPARGVSALDAPGQPFWAPETDDALFSALADCFVETGKRRLVRVDAHINDKVFAEAVAQNYAEIARS